MRGALIDDACEEEEEDAREAVDGEITESGLCQHDAGVDFALELEAEDISCRWRSNAVAATSVDRFFS
jgi:hypothetical protein